MKEKIKALIKESISTKKRVLKENVNVINNVARVMIKAYKKNKKVVVFGNGGSAADAQHLATELVCRFEKNRSSLECVALTTNSSMLTAIGNDYGFEKVFIRQVESCVKEGDVVIGISTSGNSKNVILALQQAKKQKATTVAWTGKSGGKIKNKVDFCICAPSDNTARIQEVHVLLIHILCGIIEQELFK
ncbi:MAG: D-sedoheptulose 7-phosphate isomerase [Elusimicrobiota bacterium]